MRLLALLASTLLCTSSAVVLRKSTGSSQQTLESESSNPPSFAYETPGCCFWKQLDGTGEKWCTRTNQATLPTGWNDAAASVGTSFSCNTVLWGDAQFKGKTLAFGTGVFDRLDKYEFEGTHIFKWTPDMWNGRMSSVQCTCTTCTPPCLDCNQNKPTECRACEFGYVLQGTTCVPEMGATYVTPAPNGLNAVDVCLDDKFTSCPIDTRTDVAYVGERVSPLIQAVRTPAACNATFFSGRDFTGSKTDVAPSSRIVLDAATRGRVQSVRTNCLTCGAECSDCRKDMDDPDFCTSCREANSRLDGGKCFPNTGDECCFFQNQNMTGYRVCSKTDSQWVGYEFSDKVKFARLDATCSMTTYQLVNFGGEATVWKGAAGTVQPFGYAFRSYKCYCGAPTAAPAVTTLPPPRLPAINSTVAGYTALGCYSPQAGDLSDTSYTRSMGAPADPAGWCANFCFDRGSDFFGLSNGDECRCGSVADVNKGKLADDRCSVTCKGAPYVQCGSSTNLNVYKITNAPNPQLVAAKRESDKTKAMDLENSDATIAQPDAAGRVYTYLGCFYENPENTGMPEINDNPLETTDMTPAKCATNCNGYGMFALRGNLCVCAKHSDWKALYGRAEETLCQVCANDKLSRCGSMRHNSVYRMFV